MITCKECGHPVEYFREYRMPRCSTKGCLCGHMALFPDEHHA